MYSRELLGLLENVLGKGKKTARSNYAYHCPFCQHRKPKFEINLSTNEKGENQWHCWACDKKGKTIKSLFNRLRISEDKLQELAMYVGGGSGEIQGKTVINTVISLPKEFTSLMVENTKNHTYRQAIHYLTSRGVTYEDILRYNIGYCDKGRYSNKIIVPSYNNAGVLNYFIGRSFEKDPARKYDAPPCDKGRIIGFENFINWNIPITLCEGVFDAIAIKRNVIPLFGKQILTKLWSELVKPAVKTVYFALDEDAMKTTLKYTQELMNLGKDVYILELEKKDPSELGFNSYISKTHGATPVTFRTILSKKLN